jgi:hypothetical protein
VYPVLLDVVEDVEDPVVVLVLVVEDPVVVLVLVVEDVDVTVAATTTIEVTKGLMSFEVAELARMLRR